MKSNKLRAKHLFDVKNFYLFVILVDVAISDRVFIFLMKTMLLGQTKHKSKTWIGSQKVQQCYVMHLNVSRNVYKYIQQISE